MDEREENVYKAKLAEQAERYEGNVHKCGRGYFDSIIYQLVSQRFISGISPYNSRTGAGILRNAESCQVWRSAVRIGNAYAMYYWVPLVV